VRNLLDRPIDEVTVVERGRALVVKSATPAAEAREGGELRWTIGRLPARATRTIVVEARAPEGTTRRVRVLFASAPLVHEE
jgi:hypothetical protein